MVIESPLTILQKKYADSEEVAELGIASLAHVDVSSAWRLGGRFSKGHPGTPDNASHSEQRGSWLASTQETQGELRDSILEDWIFSMWKFLHGEKFCMNSSIAVGPVLLIARSSQTYAPTSFSAPEQRERGWWLSDQNHPKPLSKFIKSPSKANDACVGHSLMNLPLLCR